jgi:hypothetical protein
MRRGCGIRVGGEAPLSEKVMDCWLEVCLGVCAIITINKADGFLLCSRPLCRALLLLKGISHIPVP